MPKNNKKQTNKKQLIDEQPIDEQQIDEQQIDNVDELKKTKVSGNRRKRDDKERGARLRLKRDNKSYAIKKTRQQEPQPIPDTNIAKKENDAINTNTEVKENNELHANNGVNVNNVPTQEKKDQTVQNPLAGMNEEWLRQHDPNRNRGSVLNDSYLKQNARMIPGMGYVEPMKPKAEEKKPEPQPSSKIPSSGMGIPGMRNNNSQMQGLEDPKKEEPKKEEPKKEEPKKEEAALPTIEQIQAENEERKQRQKEELRALERQLANHLKYSKSETDYASNLVRQQLEKKIKNLKDVVPPEERLPINDEKEQNLVDEPKENVNESQNSAKPEIPDFYNKLQQRMGTSEIVKSVKDEMSDIFKAAGIAEDEKVSDLVEYSYDSFQLGILTMYDPKTTFKIRMSEDAPMFFDNAYQSLAQAGLSPKDRIITAQKLADVMIKNYSPVAFIKDGLDRFADNYVVKNSEVLGERLLGLFVPQKDIVSLTQEVQTALGFAPQNDLNVNDEQEKEQAKEAEIKENTEQEANPEPEVKPETEVKPEPEAKTEPEVKTENEVKDDPAKPQQEKENNPKEEPELISNEGRVAVYTEKLKAYNNMYKLNINGNEFASSVIEAWTLMKSGDKQKMIDGQNVMKKLFKDTLKKAFDVEKEVAYDEHRLPEFIEIIKSSNELLRASMFAFTDLYHDRSSAALFEPTSLGGLNSKEMTDLTEGKSLWSMDQKSDEAWEIQSKEAKGIAEKWENGLKPYETMLNEMNALVESNKNSIVDRKDVLNKLAAAEWLLINNPKMMIENPEDPIHPIPNWGNRYWKALTQTREALGIDKHTSMRELIQGNYAEASKAVNNPVYNQTQIYDYVLDPEARTIYNFDSIEMQKKEFATQSAALGLGEEKKPKEKANEFEEGVTRINYPVVTEDEKENMKKAPKDFSNYIPDKTVTPELEKNNNNLQK